MRPAATSGHGGRDARRPDRRSRRRCGCPRRGRAQPGRDRSRRPDGRPGLHRRPQPLRLHRRDVLRRRRPPGVCGLDRRAPASRRPRRGANAAGRLDPRLRDGLDEVRRGPPADALGPRRGHPRAPGRDPPRIGPLRAGQLAGAGRSRPSATTSPTRRAARWSATRPGGRPACCSTAPRTSSSRARSISAGTGPNIHTAIETEALVAMLDEASRRYLAAGLTTICDPQVTSREMTAYREARARGVLRIRTVAMPLSHQLESYLAIGLVGPFGDDWLRIGGMKFYTDGAITGGTAVFSKPMGSSGQYAGTLYHEPAELAGLLRVAAVARLAARDPHDGRQAMGIMLDAVEAAMAAAPDVRCAASHRARDLADAGAASRGSPGWGWCRSPSPARSPSSATSGAITSAIGSSGRRRCASSWSSGSGRRSAATRSSRATGPLDTIAAAVRRVTPSGVRVGADQELTIEEALAGAHDRRRAGDPPRGPDRLDRGRQAGRPRGHRRRPAGRRRRSRSASSPIWMTVVGGSIAWRALPVRP